MTEVEVEESEDELERVERKLRVVMNLASLALSLYVIWDYVRDKPEVLVWKQRIADAVRKPIEARRTIRKAKAEVVFEAMQVVADE